MDIEHLKLECPNPDCEGAMPEYSIIWGYGGRHEFACGNCGRTVCDHNLEDAVAAWNAGRDPAKLDALVEAARNVRDTAQTAPEYCQPEGNLPATVHLFASDFEPLMRALAAFEGRDNTNGSKQ